MFRLGKGTNAASEEGVLACFSFAYFFFLLSGYYILRAVRDEMGIQGGIANLPWLFTGTFLAILTAAPLYAALASRFPVRKFVPLVYRFFNANLLLFWALLQWGPKTEWTARAFFIWTSVFNLFVVSVFWSVMVDIFSKGQADRLFGFIAGGGTLGALTGPLLTMNLVGWIGTANLLLFSCLFLELTVICIRELIKRSPKKEEAAVPIGGSALSGIRIIFRSPYLLMISLYLFLMTTGSTFLYLTQAEIVSGTLGESAERTRIFALIDFGVNLLTFFIQTLVTGRVITKWGVAWVLALLPVWMLLALVTLSGIPHLLVLIAFQMGARAIRYALTHPAREILFTPLSREEKYKSKNFIDTVVYRGGDAANAWFFQGLRALLSLPHLLAAGALAALAWLGVGIFLGRTHQRMKREKEGV